MTVQLNEPIVAALLDRLEDNLATHITAINGEHADDFDIETPAQILDYMPTPQLLHDYPTVGIGDGQTTFEDDVGYSATGRHVLLVVAYLVDADERALTTKLRRYSQAIVRTVLDDRNLGSAAWGTGLIGVYPGPALADNEDPEQVTEWMSWIGVRIWAKTDEE